MNNNDDSLSVDENKVNQKETTTEKSSIIMPSSTDLKSKLNSNNENVIQKLDVPQNNPHSAYLPRRTETSASKSRFAPYKFNRENSPSIQSAKGQGHTSSNKRLSKRFEREGSEPPQLLRDDLPNKDDLYRQRISRSVSPSPFALSSSPQKSASTVNPEFVDEPLRQDLLSASANISDKSRSEHQNTTLTSISSHDSKTDSTHTNSSNTVLPKDELWRSVEQEKITSSHPIENNSVNDTKEIILHVPSHTDSTSTPLISNPSNRGLKNSTNCIPSSQKPINGKSNHNEKTVSDIFDGSDVSDIPDYQFLPSSDDIIVPVDSAEGKHSDSDSSASSTSQHDEKFRKSSLKVENPTASNKEKIHRKKKFKSSERKHSSDSSKHDHHDTDPEEDVSSKKSKKRGRPPGSSNKKSLSSWEKAQIDALEQFSKKEKSGFNNDDIMDSKNRHLSEDEEMKEISETVLTEIQKEKESKKTIQLKNREDGVILTGRKRPLPFSAINTPDRSGRTPIFKYAAMGDLSSCRALIAHGADLNIRDYAGWTALHEASNNGHVDVLQLLLEYGADVNASGDHGDTALHDAVAGKNEETIHMLLLYGANIDAANQNGQKPIDLASDDPEILEILYEWKKMGLIVHRRDAFGRTELHISASEGNAQQVQKLLHYGSDVHAVDHAGWAPIHEAAAHGHKKALEILLEYDANVDHRGENKQTPLHVACLLNHYDCVRVLLKYGAAPNKKDFDSKKPTDLTSNESIHNLFSQDMKPYKTAKFKCRAINQQQHILPIIPSRHESRHRKMSVETQSTTSTSNMQPPPSSTSTNIKPSGHLSREERKFLALLRTIESMENDQGPASSISYGSYYVGYPGYEDYEAARMRRKSSAGSAKASRVGQIKEAPPSATKKRGRPKKSLSLDHNSEPSSQLELDENENENKLNDIFTKEDGDSKLDSENIYMKDSLPSSQGGSFEIIPTSSPLISKRTSNEIEAKYESLQGMDIDGKKKPDCVKEDGEEVVFTDISSSPCKKEKSKKLVKKSILSSSSNLPTEFSNESLDSIHKRKVSESASKEIRSPLLKKKKKLLMLGTGGYMDMSSTNPAGESVAQPMFVKVKSEESIPSSSMPMSASAAAQEEATPTPVISTKRDTNIPVHCKSPITSPKQTKTKLERHSTPSQILPSATKKDNLKEVKHQESLPMAKQKKPRKVSSTSVFGEAETMNDVKSPSASLSKAATKSSTKATITKTSSNAALPQAQPLPTKIRRISSQVSVSDGASEKSEAPQKPKFVIKKKSKKSLLGILGYQDMEQQQPSLKTLTPIVNSPLSSSTLAAPNDTQQMQETKKDDDANSKLSLSNKNTEGPEKSGERANQGNEGDNRKNCLPLYTLTLPRLSDSTECCDFVLDLQLGMIFGHPSGRPILDANPKMVKRRASDEEKKKVEQTMMSFTLLECMKAVLGEDACRWTKKVQIKSIDGKELTGMKLSNVDLYLVEYESAKQYISALKDMPTKALSL